MSLHQRFWLVLTALVVATVAILAALGDRVFSGAPGPLPSPAGTTAGPSAATAGAAGLGDPYLPEAGGSGYDVQNYDVVVSATGAGDPLNGRTTITATARQDLDSFHLDLFPVATAVTVDGTPATFGQHADNLAVTAVRPDRDRPAIAAGATFTVTVDYAGSPHDVRTPGFRAYYANGDEFVIAGEPAAASLWYPVNDHPRDPATMRFTVTVPDGVEAICAGRLLEHGDSPENADADRWVWQVDAPTVTYATFLGVGQFDVEQGTAGGRPYTYSVSRRLDVADRAAALRWLDRTPKAVKKLEKYLGPYPFSGIGGFVPSVQVEWGGLETVMNPVYHPGMIGDEALLNHELAHMWFGDTVTLYEWNDIFNNESLTTYAEWLTTGSGDAGAKFDRIYHGQADRAAFWAPALSDPGFAGLFVRVYDRGPLVVHALRTRLGDDTFFDLFRTWAQQQGPHSLEDFRRVADDATPDDLTTFFAEWLDQTDRPEATEANGVPR
ncbi:M1 family metallopeptidase [Micropruina sonneratiae]|uniref:M1 family metallopeptidase n=1 Tax=Micropruina sonneratiae TaxID=2986940 RepID=UPI002227437B|nr:M1 family metallopeptidase [Micropruina sp. KQZ13P-5]MCW3159257.1 M1 family metallopeptidase [Micropruina sp. KQZ13P-5]